MFEWSCQIVSELVFRGAERVRAGNSDRLSFSQMTSPNLKAQSCSRRGWRRCRSTPPTRSGRRAGAGGCFASGSRSTEWTWRPSSLTRGSSAMEVTSQLERERLHSRSFTNVPQKNPLVSDLCVFSHCEHVIITVLWNRNVHPGYYGDGLNAIIVFAVCFMPESNQPNYRYIMDNLFKWVFLWATLTLRSRCFSSGANGISPAAGTWSAPWSCWWPRTTWSSTWTEPRPGRGCPPWAGWGNATSRSTGGEPLRRSRRLTAPLTGNSAQVKEEPEVSDHCPSLLVYPYPPGTHKTLHKVRDRFNNPSGERSWHVSPDSDTSLVFPQLQIQSENPVCLQLGSPRRAGPDGVCVDTRLHQTVSVRSDTISDGSLETYLTDRYCSLY